MNDSRLVYPTPDLGLLPDLWAEAEKRYPPTKGWGLKIFRRFLSAPHDGAVWGLTFTRGAGLLHGAEAVTADDVSPSASFRALLDQIPEKAHENAVRYVQTLVDQAEAEAQARRDQLEALRSDR